MVDALIPRICIVSSWYPNSENQYSGIFVHEFAKRLLDHGFAVLTITTSLGMEDKKYSVLDGVPVFRVTLKKGDFPKWLLNISRLFRRNDVVHVHAVNFVGAVLVLLGKLLNKPVVLTTHRADVLPTRSIVHRLLRSFALKLADTVTAVSSSTWKLAVDAGASKEKTITIYNAADENMFKPRSRKCARQKLGLDLDLKLVLFVGNLIPRKGVKYLVNAWQSIVKNTPESLLIIIGDGLERKTLENLTRKLDLTGKVKFLGRISKNLLSSYYNAADVFVLPSLHEGQAIVLLEAMASAVPIIATNVASNRETVVNEVNGYLVEPKNPHELSEKIEKILQNKHLMKSFSQNSLKIYKERFSEEKQIAIFKEVYSQLTKNKKMRNKLL